MSSRANLSDNWRVKSDNQALDPPSRQPPRSAHQRPSNPDNRATSVLPNTTSHTLNTIRGEDDPRTLQAIADGRRVYVGNMPYMAKPEDVKGLFADGEYSIEHINMSIDPFTGRNPSYCFVELQTKEQAERAIHELDGKELVGRSAKVRPGVAPRKGIGTGTNNDIFNPRLGQHSRPAFDRWTRTDAADHWKGYSEQKRRLYVGGLPQMHDHYSVDADVRNLFQGFSIDAVSKVIIPRSNKYENRYLFVDFPSAEEAERARRVVNGKTAWGVNVRVSHAKSGDSPKVDERKRWEEEQALRQQAQSEDAGEHQADDSNGNKSTRL